MPEVEYFGKHFVNIPFAVHEVNHTRTLRVRQARKRLGGRVESLLPLDALFVLSRATVRGRLVQLRADPVMLVLQSQNDTFGP
jgi:hypothetical protein